MNVSEALAQVGVLVLGQVHLRLLAELAGEVFQVGVGRGLGEIGNADGGGVVARLAAGVLLLVPDERRHVLVALGGRSVRGRRSGGRLRVENLLNVRRSVSEGTVGREMAVVTEPALGELVLRVQDGVARLFLLLARDELHVDVVGHESCVRIRAFAVLGRVAELGQLLPAGDTLRNDVLRDLVRPHHFDFLVIFVVLVFGQDFLALCVPSLGRRRQRAGIQLDLIGP